MSEIKPDAAPQVPVPFEGDDGKLYCSMTFDEHGRFVYEYMSGATFRARFEPVPTVVPSIPAPPSNTVH